MLIFANPFWNYVICETRRLTVLIDWFTVVAQIVNFLVLVALMKRFLYGPLVRRHRRARKVALRIGSPMPRAKKLRQPHASSNWPKQAADAEQ